MRLPGKAVEAAESVTLRELGLVRSQEGTLSGERKLAESCGRRFCLQQLGGLRKAEQYEDRRGNITLQANHCGPAVASVAVMPLSGEDQGFERANANWGG